MSAVRALDLGLECKPQRVTCVIPHPGQSRVFKCVTPWGDSGFIFLGALCLKMKQPQSLYFLVSPCAKLRERKAVSETYSTWISA